MFYCFLRWPVNCIKPQIRHVEDSRIVSKSGMTLSSYKEKIISNKLGYDHHILTQRWEDSKLAYFFILRCSSSGSKLKAWGRVTRVFPSWQAMISLLLQHLWVSVVLLRFLVASPEINSDLQKKAAINIEPTSLDFFFLLDFQLVLLQYFGNLHFQSGFPLYYLVTFN